MAPQIDYFLDDDDIKDANNAGSFLFDAPSDAVVRGKKSDPNDEKYKATWIQSLEITEAKMYEDAAKDKDGNEYGAICIEVSFQVPSGAVRAKSGETDPNAGRNHRAWYRLVGEARKNPKHPKYKANNFNTGRVLGILRSIWGTAVIPHGTNPNLGDFFGDSPAPVVGKTVVAHMKQSRYKGEDRDELTDFIALEMQGS